MVIPIYLDLSELADKYSGLDQSAIDDVCDNIAKSLAVRYAAKLEDEAVATLHQTRKRYIHAINVVDTGRLEGTVVLDFSKDPLVAMLEEGASAFDIKTGLFNSPKVKISKNGGRYITVPFRMGSPEAVGDSDVFSGNLPSGVYDVAKDAITDISSKGGSRSSGLLLKDLPVQYQKREKRAVINNSAGKILFESYTHKNSLYEGVMKFNDSVTGQNTYGSFRRVSEELISPEGKTVGSDPNSWIHKGLERYDLVGKALNNFNQETEVQVALNREFERLGLM